MEGGLRRNRQIEGNGTCNILKQSTTVVKLMKIRIVFLHVAGDMGGKKYAFKFHQPFEYTLNLIIYLLTINVP